jgi:hypothetical protein
MTSRVCMDCVLASVLDHLCRPSRLLRLRNGRALMASLLLMGSLIGFARLSKAQGGGSITGTVQDPSGAVVANATVTIENPSATMFALRSPIIREVLDFPTCRSIRTT